MVGNNDMETEQQLKEIGTRLLELPSSIHELLNLLDKLERLLVNVDQAPSISMQDALLPGMKALISDPLLKNSDADIKVLVASCLCELTRITAPDPPYNDELMKEIFQLMVAAFEKLSPVSSPSYMKAVSILDTISKVRSFLIMLDIGLDELIAKMFQQFLKIIRSNHPHVIFVAMETVMTMIIDESDDISMGLVSPLLASLKKENQSASPTAWKLGEKVILNCAAKLKPYLKEAIKHEGRAFNDYAPIVASICQDESRTILRDHVNGSDNHLVTKEGLLPDAASLGEALHVVDGMPQSTTNVNSSTGHAVNGVNHNIKKQPELCSLIQHGERALALGNADHEVELDMEMGTLPRKRGRKPNSLMNPEEGYDHCWNPTGRKETDGLVNGSSPSSDESLPHESLCKRARPKKQGNDMIRDSDPSLRESKSLHTEPMEASLAEYEASLRKQSDGRSKSEVKKQKSTRRIRLPATTVTESHPSVCLLSDEKDDVLSAPDEKPLHRSTQIRVRNIEKDGDLAETDPTRRSLVMSISNVDSARSRFKRVKSSNRGRNCNGELPLENPKKKRTPRTEVIQSLETPDPDDQLIGRNIKVWWPMDKMFYKGVVASYDPVKRRHKILYADGDVEMLNLKKQKWELIGDNVLDEELQVTHIPKADCSSDLPKQGKLKVKSEPVELRLNLERSGACNTSQRKSRRSGNRSAGFVDKAINDPSRPDWVLEGGGKCPTKKLNAKSKLSAFKSEPTTQDTASPSVGSRDALEVESPKGTNKSSDVVPSKENIMAEEKPRSDEQDEVRSVDSEETL